VEVNNPIRNLPRLAARAFPAPSAPYLRPEFLAPAAAALGLSLVLLLVQRWPLTMFFAPTFVLACRYYELARFATVRPSRLAFLLILSCAAACALWVLTHRSPGVEQPLTLILVGTALAMAVHLFGTQRRLAKSQISRSLLHTVDEDAPYWACGGLLAILPVVLLIGGISGLMWWRSPLLLLWGLAGVVVLAAQLRSHPWFPRLALVWLATWFAIETFSMLASGGDDAGDDAAVSFTVLALIVAMAIYLQHSPRVRRTFGPAALAPAENPIALDARGPLPMHAVRGVRGTG